MLRSRGFRPSNDKIVRLELHPTYPWLASADFSDNVVVWDWEHRQVVYELNAGGVDTRRLVGAKLQKLAEGEPDSKSKITEAIPGGSVKQIKFYDEDVRFWHSWINRNAAAEAPVVNQQFSSIGGPYQALRGRHFLVICCENKVIFLDMVTMRSRDVPKQMLDNKSPLCMEFLSRSSTTADGPWIAFGGSDGVIRVLSLATWQLVRKYVGGHKGSVTYLTTFLSSSGESLLISGGSDGLLVLWTAEKLQELREISPKQTVKAHDGGVYAIELARVLGGAPQLITIGADKTLAIWDTISFKELKRIKPVAKLACHSVASWCHPRAPALDILVCVKDSNIWSIQQSAYSAITRPFCDLSSQISASTLIPNKKLKCYCMVVHPLQPHIVASGTNYGVILSEFDAKALPPAVALPTPATSKEHTAVFLVDKEIRLLSFQLSAPLNLNAANTGPVVDTARPRHDSSEASHMQVKQSKKHIGNVPYDVYAHLSVSKSGKYVAVVWPEIPHFTIYKVADWSIVDSGSAKYFAWDTCKERYALLETTLAPRLPPVTKGRKAKEAAAQAAAAAAAAANAATSATVQIRIILDDGSANQLTRAIEGRAEPVIGLQGGALLGVAYKFPRRLSFPSATSVGISGVAPELDDNTKAESPSNFQLYSWETFKPIGALLPQPEWTAWDDTVEYCAFAYPHYVVISSLRPQYRYLGNVAIAGSTGGVWHRRQLFLATLTTIECVFVDAGITAIDLERKRKKEEMKTKESQAKSVAEHGELALITVDQPAQLKPPERIPLRPPMLQVVRLASFQHAPTIPPIIMSPRFPRLEVEGLPKEPDDKKPGADVAVAGGGVSVAIARLPQEQKRPVGPLVVVGVRDGVLWLIDRYMTAHAIALGHPGIRCRCLAAYGDAISAVKWATRLGREHHDDLAQFLLGMGYATEALHLPGISKRLEFELAMQSNDLKRALQSLLTLSNSRNIGEETGVPSSIKGVLSAPTIDEKNIEAVQGIIKYAKEFLDLIDAADATAQSQIAKEALRRLAAAGAIKGALRTQELRGLALRLASHGELTRLGVLVNTMIAAGQGREGALGAALLGDSSLLEKAWQETGMYPEAAMHAHAHGRATLKTILQSWNQILEKDSGLVPLKQSSPAFSQSANQVSTDDLVLKELTSTDRKPLIEIVPPGNILIGNTAIAPLKSNAMKSTGIQSGQPLLLEGPKAMAVKPNGVQSGQPLLLEGPTAKQEEIQSTISLTASTQPTQPTQPLAAPSPDIQQLATNLVPNYSNGISAPMMNSIPEALATQPQPAASIEQVLSSGISQLSLSSSQPNLIQTSASTDLMQISAFDNLSATESKAPDATPLEKASSSASSSLADFLS